MTSPAPAVVVCQNPATLAVNAASLVVRSAREAIEKHGRFTLVLAGGATPEKTYALLAQPGWAAAIDWARTCLFFGDERFVPPDDERSNFGMVQRTLLARVPVPPAHVVAVPTRGRTAAECAAVYAGNLAGFFPAASAAAPPGFDLILLGLGDDGHTASLFPGAPALQVTDAWVTWSPPGTLPPLVDRITLTFPVLNAARHVAFLVSGGQKAAVLREVLEGQPTREQRPAAGVRPVDGVVTWLVDEDAARLLTRGT